MNTKHTPGKWEFSPWGGQIKVESVERTPGLPIVKEIALCGGINAHANARLIAAAPDLYRELQHLARCLHPWIEAGHSVPGIATLNGAFAAIAKAEGEQA